VSGASRLVVVEDEAALARAAAENFVSSAARATAARGRFDVALSGGTTPKAAYALLAAEPFREAVDWPKVRFFFGDERCVPPGDAESNYKTARDGLFEPLVIDAGQIFRMHGEDEPQAAAAAYATLLRDAGSGGPPVFDLVILGMGPDGHTASLFPGTDPLEDDAALVRAPYVAKFATHRITLTPRVINAARAVAIATGGSAKADALRGVLEGPHDPTRYPIQIVAPSDGALTWFVDKAAAALLTKD
jgi:6-phosphogluconolactonase